MFSMSSRFPYWEIFTGGKRTLIKNSAAIPSRGVYTKVLRKLLQEDMSESTTISPVHLHQLCQDENTTWRFRNVSLSGYPIPRTITRLGSKVCDRLVVLYGSSEMPCVSYGIIDNGKEHLDYECGKPVPGIEVKVVDSNERLLPRGKRGELYIRSVIPFYGYMLDEARTTDSRTATGWYKSGDSAIITKDGVMVVEGRISDSVIESREGYLSVTIWEDRLRQHSAIQDAVVVIFDDDEHYKRVCYAILPKPKASITDAEVVDFLLDTKNRIADLWDKTELPTTTVFFDHPFPKTHSGKINRKMVAEICKENLTGKSITRE